MSNHKIGFVILHYCAMEMTIQCVETIQSKIKDVPYEIVVVDNASPNGTGKELLDRYQNTERVTVLLSEDNLGFAKGNNIGYDYARNQLGCDLISIQNNDVMILQDDFATRLVEIYEREPFAVLGPHISLLNEKENAMYYELKSLAQLKKERNLYIKRLKRLKSSMYRFWDVWEAFKFKLRVLLGKLHIMPEVVLHEDLVEGAYEKHDKLILHGCCLIFSELYAQEYQEAFDPATFMFREEEILYLRCVKAKLPMHYDPYIKVLHMEDVATNFVYKTVRTKEIFNLENQIDSMQILMERLKEVN